MSDYDPLDPFQSDNLLEEEGVNVYLQEIPLPKHKAMMYEGKGQSKPKSWYLSWRHGEISLDVASERHGRRVAALFVYLWRKGIDAGLARDLACCYFASQSV
jgi:hypothetical protein